MGKKPHTLDIFFPITISKKSPATKAKTLEDKEEKFRLTEPDIPAEHIPIKIFIITKREL